MSLSTAGPGALLALLLASGPARAEGVLAFTTDARPFVGDRRGVQVFNLDDVPRLEARLSQGLAADPARAKAQIQARINTADGQALLRALPEAYAGATEAFGLSIERLPAVVFERRFVVYGESNLEAARAAYARHQATPGARR